MTMRKQVLLFAGLCLFALLTWGSPCAQAADYSDVEGHWAQETIERWSDSGVLKGYDDGWFGPNDPVSRGQLSEILYRLWGCGPQEGHTFPDVAADAWYHDAVVTMNACGVALNQGKNMFPDQPLTREEAFYMVAKAFDIGRDLDLKADPATEQVSKWISDGREVEPSFWSRINSMLGQGYLHGSGGMLHPKDIVSRSEILTVIDNMFDLYISSPGSYTVPADQTALITCPDVTLTYVPTKRYHESKVYLMAPAAHGVTFDQQEGKGNEIYLSVRGISEDGATWTESGVGFNGIKDEAIHLSEPRQVADLRFAGGVGIACCPYLIETAEQFIAMDDTPGPMETFANNKSRYFSLLEDVTLPKNLPSLTVFGSVNPHLMGNGHTVTLCVEGGGELLVTDVRFPEMGYGLFCDWSGECRDLILDGSIHITIGEDYPWPGAFVGGFTNQLHSDGLLENCISRVNIQVDCANRSTLYLEVGGLVGNAKASTLLNCNAQGQVALSVHEGNSAVPAVGGLVGVCTVKVTQTHPFPDEGKESEVTYDGGAPVLLRGCCSSTAVSVQGGRHSSAGGLVGQMTWPVVTTGEIPEEALPRIENCWSTATASAAGASFQSDCGGIAGQVATGAIQGCWAKPTVSIAKGDNYQNTGSIAGCLSEWAKIQDCWGDASDCQVSKDGEHCGGIVGRMWGSVSNCWVLGAENFAPKDTISYASWTSGPVTGCVDMTALSSEKREAFYGSCGWDFDAVWDKSGAYPILRSCDAVAQRTAQKRW